MLTPKTVIAAALCFGLAIGGPILIVGSQFHRSGHVSSVSEQHQPGRPAFVKEDQESYFLKWLEDPVAQATAVLALFTYLLFRRTADLARDTREASAKALAASTRATDTLVRIERPYVTAGGDYVKTANGYVYMDPTTGKSFFRFEVGNYGKTAAVLTAFSVRFDSLTNVQGRVSDVDCKDYPYHDLLEPGTRHKVIKDDIDISVNTNSGTNVAYGACWYRSGVEEKDHVHCFALKLHPDRTVIDADILGLDKSYRHWD